MSKGIKCMMSNLVPLNLVTYLTEFELLFPELTDLSNSLDFYQFQKYAKNVSVGTELHQKFDIGR